MPDRSAPVARTPDALSAGEPVLLVDSGDGERRVLLSAYLDATAADTAEREANQWIKSLRSMRVGDSTFRDRFTYRGDSLWWFAELFLHKRRTVVAMFRTHHALAALVERERPIAVTVVRGDRVVRTLAPQFAQRRQIRYNASRGNLWDEYLDRLARRARSLFYAAVAALARMRPLPPVPPGRADVAFFVHAAFWREETRDESYVGPVMRELAAHLPAGAMRLVGVGPRTNFHARRWRHRLAPRRDSSVRSTLLPIEAFAPWSRIRPSLAFWRRRRHVARALLASTDLRDAAIIGGCDAWPLIRAELDGIAQLQLPWSVRAMDEAAAALDVLQPRVVVTYAEAGGWGRALVLEARRRRIPVVGLQHGYIYRHWLNYLHEPDELQPSPHNAADAGFPRPTLTLVFDDLAACHLIEAGRFPDDAILVTGSARLDAIVATVGGMTEADRQRVRASLGAMDRRHAVVIAAKFTQIASALPALVAEAARMSDVQVIIKCHPAEPAAPYEAVVRGVPHVTIAPPSIDLAAVTAIARALVTVNSTAAIEAMLLDVPTLVVSLPNNLSPLVAAGAVAGAAGLDEIGPALRAVLYDEAARARLARSRRAFIQRYSIRADGHAATRAAVAILAYTQNGPVVDADRTRLRR